jgi:predicted DNA-binding transcriptional regulator YafY
LQDTPFYQDIDNICQKIQAVLNGKSIRYLDQIQTIFYSPKTKSKPSVKGNEIVTTLTHAMLNRRTAKMYYCSKGRKKAKAYTIDPYLLSPYGGLYLEAWVHEYQEIRTFKVKHIKKIEVTDQSFQPPDKKILQDRLFHSFGIVREKPFDVKIRFHKSLASKLKEWHIHPTKKLTKLKSGDILLTMHTGGWNEIIWWVLSFLPRAEVIEPKQMREQIKKILEESLKNYQ